ncbi:MAG: class I SAM-dependent methyltransferase [Acidimicrobiales bacterium]
MLSCRGCSAGLSEVFVDLGLSPIANNLPLAGTAELDPLYPLIAWFCERCLLVQLAHVQAPELIFSDYLYLSSYSTTWLEHTARYAAEATKRLSLSPKSLVVELASNDGHLLRNFIDAGCRVMGVEPAANVAVLAVERGVPTYTEFFGAAVADKIRSNEGSADLVVANNVLAHVPDVHDFIEGVRRLLSPSGTATFEFPHLQNLIAQCQFDTIYHEHFSYFSLHTAQALFEQHGLHIYDVQRLPTHGGSLRLWLAHSAAGVAPAPSVDEVALAEQAAGLTEPLVYSTFSRRCLELRDRLRDVVDEIFSSGKRLAGYGAPAKATTLLNYCGLGREKLEFTVDANPYKQGRMVPGVRVPIYAPSVLDKEPPDVVFVLAWNLRVEISRLLARTANMPRLLFHQPTVELI